MLAILTYHSLDTSGSVISVAPQRFAEQMARLAHMGMRVLALRDALAWRERTGAWPPRAVVLTFDDGYASVYEAAVPILARHAFGATVFLVSRHVGGRNDWCPPPRAFGHRCLLSWEQAAEIAAAGLEIGAHTAGHADLRRLAPAQAEAEIVGGRRDIEARLQRPVETFAYPFGGVSRAARGLVQHEFRAGCTTVLKRAADEPLETLPRVDMHYVPTASALERLVSGRLDHYLALRRCGRAVRRLFAE